MIRIRHLLASKGTEVWSIEPEDPVLEALQLMADRHVGALPVMRGDKLVGIISERDYARKVVLMGRSSSDTPVWQIMSEPVITSAPDDTVDTCMALMTERRIRHLPVVDKDKVVGIVSIGDLVKAVIGDQQHTIEELERYIAG